MDIAAAKLLSSYNQYANGRMNAILEKLDDSQWTREFSGYFKSIKTLCNHLYIADFVWLRRFSGLRRSAYMDDKLLSEDINFGMDALEDPIDYVSKRKRLDGLIVRFVDGIGPQDLESTLAYKDSGGHDHRKSFGALVLHMFNHETHHRGMISLYLENLGIENDFNSLSEMIEEL
ncbi:MAG TPA: DinB family protein [Rectinemataceae bacterium]|nr:DinB family protein [Rectinemataceae bacterium]